MKSLSTDQKMARKETILIVDDEAGPRESLRMILKPLYEIYTASDGQEALQLIQSKDIDVVTLDLNMPGLSGIDVLKEIRNLRPKTEVFGRSSDVWIPLPVARISAFPVADVISIVAKSFERRNYALKITSLVESIQRLRSNDEEG